MQSSSPSLIWISAFAALCLLVAVYAFFKIGNESVKKYVYKATPQGKLSLYVHLPNDWQSSDHRPAIVFFFGGGWISGGPDHFKRQAAHLANRGMVAVRADYRTDSKHHTTPDAAVSDGRDALQWMRENATKIGIDPDRIVASGASAGGHIAACLALCEDATEPPAMLILFNPVLDITNATRELEFSVRELELIDMIGPEAAASLSPNQRISITTPPSLHLIGDKDPLIAQVEDFAIQSEALNIHSKVMVAADQTHGFFNKEPWQTATLLAADDYLVENGYLKPDPSAEQPDVQLRELPIDALQHQASHQ
tara:strand:+ start:29331 stop:30260 length:930 start_codon:yes stop_codon:yes gene_type:complete